MDTEPKNTSEDAEMAECDGEKVVTMMDVLQEQEDFEEDVNAVLGASDDKNCTYSKGYVKRQAIYACITCCSEAKDDPSKRAGVCLACSLTCHENHDLIELYTKRNFKCDCGNPKFNSHPCQFTPDKTDLNEDNNYNQNFNGVYCVCQRPYPDPDSTVDVEMIQCIICEDWLHATHLEATVPDNDQYSEMICKSCMEKNDFLHDYSNLAVNIDVDVDVETNGIDSNDKICNGDIKLETFKDETVKATDVEMLVKAETDNNTNNPEDYKCETKESIEKKDDDKSVDTPMETDKSKQADINNTKLEEATKKDTKESSEKLDNDENIVPDVAKDSIVEETVKDICMISGNAGKDVNNQNESAVNEEEQNEKEEPTEDTKQSESAAEDKTSESIEKSEEQLEEERLLADPDSDNKKSNGDNKIAENNVQTSTDADKNSEKTGAESNETLRINENEEVKVDNKDKQNESRNIESSPTKTISAETQIEQEIKDSLKENGTTENKEAVTNNVSHNGEPEVQNKEKLSEKRKLFTEESSGTDIKKVKLDEANKPCVRPKGVQKVYRGATFWPSTFRQKLCTCRECITMYNDLSVLYLIDPEDTVTAYENLGKERIDGKPASQYEKGLQALSSLDRIQQINALTEYNKMRDKLLDFLKSFKDRKEVVKEEDIKAFFAEMKPKREPDGVYFCR